MSINVALNGQDNPNQNNFYGTIGTTALQIIKTSVLGAAFQPQLRQFLQIHNPGNQYQLAFTLDGTTPIINGNGFQIYAGGEWTYDIKVPPGAVTLVSNGAGAPYSIMST